MHGRDHREAPAAGLALLLAVLLLLTSPMLSAQSDMHVWGAAVATGSIGAAEAGSAPRFWLEGQGRFNDDASRWNQGIVRGAIGYPVGKRAVLWGGYAFVPTRPIGRGDDIVEHRLWQQLTWSPQVEPAGFRLSSRTRLEQRDIEDAAPLAWRFRQFVKATRPLGADQPTYLSLWAEAFVNFNDTRGGPQAGFDQNRVFGGLGFRLSPTTRFEAGYLHQWVNRHGRADAHNHILSLTLLLNLP